MGWQQAAVWGLDRIHKMVRTELSAGPREWNYGPRVAPVVIIILISALILLLTSFPSFYPKTYLSVAYPLIFLATDLMWHFFAPISLNPI